MFIRILIAAIICAVFQAQAFADDSLWQKYKDTFITRDGRTIDFRQGHVSHSEGQGYAMTLAVASGDRETFDKVWKWTVDNIKVRTDNLFAWQWGKRQDGLWAVIDYNNATDGDVMIAYALLKASEKWNEPKYAVEAKKTVEDIRKTLSVKWQGRVFLLPSYFGFYDAKGAILNPSYMALKAFKEFSKADDAKFWDKAYVDASYLLLDVCFGSMCLPADWVRLEDKRIAAAFDKSRLYGAEAVRTILHLAASDAGRFPKGLDAMFSFYERNGYMPSWVDVETDSVSLKPASGGYYAVYALAAKKKGNEKLSKKLMSEAKGKLEGEKDDYYSFSLYLLADAMEKL